MIARVALTGAQGTGKSTLARAITDRLRGARYPVELYTGVGDAVIGEGLAIGPAAGAAAVRAFARLHQARESAATAPIQVFDRCLLDTLAYAHVLGCIPAAELESLRRAALLSCGCLARLLWLRVATDYPVLSARDESPEFRRSVDAAIGTLARENDIRLVEHAIPPDSMDTIAVSVVEMIKRMGVPPVG